MKTKKPLSDYQRGALAERKAWMKEAKAAYALNPSMWARVLLRWAEGRKLPSRCDKVPKGDRAAFEIMKRALDGVEAIELCVAGYLYIGSESKPTLAAIYKADECAGYLRGARDLIRETT